MRIRQIAFGLVALLAAAALPLAAAPVSPTPLAICPTPVSTAALQPGAAAADAAAPAPLALSAFTRIPGPCRVFCTSGVSCTGQSYCIDGPGGIICDGHAFSCLLTP